MRRRVVALAVCAALVAPMLAGPAAAGGRFPPRRGFGAHAARAVPGGARAAPDVRPKSAFGSPGGFPFRDWEHYPRRTDVVPSGHHARRHAHAGRFPHTVFLYTPATLYGLPADPPAPVVDVSTVVHASPIVYVSPTVVVATPPPSAVAPAAEPLPPLPTVVEHPTGRYELRGDGVTTPYVWVWIPNPPPGPPVAPTPTSGEPRAGSATANRSQIYRWTDDEGTISWTNRPESIPEAHRPRARGPGEIARP
jgi:hypothetical protein